MLHAPCSCEVFVISYFHFSWMQMLQGIGSNIVAQSHMLHVYLSGTSALVIERKESITHGYQCSKNLGLSLK